VDDATPVSATTTRTIDDHVGSHRIGYALHSAESEPKGCVMAAIPSGYEALLERPLYGHLATTRPDGNAQVNPMWFDWDGEVLRFTHTSKRQKYRNVTANPNVAMSISDPDNPYRYLEVRGVVEEIVPDPTGAFYLHLNDRYSGPLTEPPPDKADRVILVVRPTGFSKQ
jgi:PPOX class probable F420-dependent enzyme